MKISAGHGGVVIRSGTVSGYRPENFLTDKLSLSAVCVQHLIFGIVGCGTTA